MRNYAIAAIASAACLSAPAFAAPFSVMASSEADTPKAQDNSRGLIESAFTATANAFGIVFTAGDQHEEDIILRYSENDESCPAEEDAESDGESEEAEAKKPVGPEPIYFGF